MRSWKLKVKRSCRLRQVTRSCKLKMWEVVSCEQWEAEVVSCESDVMCWETPCRVYGGDSRVSVSHGGSRRLATPPPPAPHQTSHFTIRVASGDTETPAPHHITLPAPPSTTNSGAMQDTGHLHTLLLFFLLPTSEGLRFKGKGASSYLNYFESSIKSWEFKNLILFRLKEMPLKTDYRFFTTSPPRLIINLILIPPAGCWCLVVRGVAAIISPHFQACWNRYFV